MALSIALGIFMVAGMVIPVTLGGVNAGRDADGLRQSVKDIKKETESLEKRFNIAIVQEKALDYKMRTEIVDSIDRINQLSAQARVAKRAFSEKYRTLQLTGVVFIVTVFFLLLLKEAGLLDALQALILSPFKKKS